MSFGSLPSVLGNGGGIAISVIGGKGLFADGTAAAPSISFAADTDTGFYRAAANQIRLALGGNGVYTFTSTGNISSTATGATLLLSDATGAIGLTAAGTNQNITLTPSGTADAIIAVATGTSAGLQINNSNAGTPGAHLWLQQLNGTGNSRNWGLETNFTTGGDFAITQSTTTGGSPSAVKLYVSRSGNLLIGTTDETGLTGAGGLKINSSTAGAANAGALVVAGGISAGNTGSAASYFGGGLTFAASTTSAGGITFGTDLNLFRSAAGVLRVSSTSNYSTEITNSSGTGAASVGFNNTGGSLYVGSDSVGGSALGGGTAYAGVIATGTSVPLIFRTNSTTALTISTSQAATFAGTVSPQQATTAAAPSYVKGAIYFDTTLNKLRVGGATAWETITSV